MEAFKVLLILICNIKKYCLLNEIFNKESGIGILWIHSKSLPLLIA